MEGDLPVTTSATHPLPKVAVGRHLSSESVNLENYRSWVGDTLLDEIHELSRELKQLRICNVNATAAGGGVAELLSRIIPVQLALGISTDWRLIYGDKDFFSITKSFHNALQDGEMRLTADTTRAYLDHIAIQESLNGKVVDWMEHVTDEQYRK